MGHEISLDAKPSTREFLPGLGILLYKAPTVVMEYILDGREERIRPQGISVLAVV